MLGSELVMLWKGRIIPNGRQGGVGAERFGDPGISYRAGVIDPVEFMRYRDEVRGRPRNPTPVESGK